MTNEAPNSLTRALRQQLEGWGRAGLTHLPIAPRQLIIATPKSTPSLAASRAASPSLPKGGPGDATRPVSSATPSPRTEMPLPVVATPLEPSPHPAGSRDDREWRLAQLRQRVAACVRCQQLASTRTQTVFGVGSPEAKIMFIGEAPGADEDAQGEPFVGAAGQLLDKIIAASGLKREDIYICNILRCRPPGNRKPLPEEASNCREYLDGQIAVIDPDYIICWGATAAQNLLNTLDSIGRLRGRFFQHGRAKVLCTYHPSYLLRNPSAKKDVWDDMKLFLKEAGMPVPKS